MSERDQYDENNPPDFEMGVVDGDETRNRPAMGATLADSTQELDLDWKGNSAATDFLGIDGDPRGDVATGTGGPGLPNDSWLHGIEAQAGQPAPAAATATAADDDQPEAPQAAPRSKREPLPPVRSPWTRIVAAVFVLALAGGGGWYYWKTQHETHPQPNPVDVATKPTKPTKTPVTKTTPKPTPVTTTDPVAVTPVNTEPVDVNPTPADPVEIPIVTTPEVAVTTETPIVDPTSVTPPTTPVTNNTPTSTPSTFRVPPPSATPIPGAVRRATEDDFANMWREEAVPLEAISGTVRLRTLNVGQVRVILDSGEYFEGQLYAVGQDRVWLDLDLGRIAFEAGSVRNITRIARPAASKTPGQKRPDLSGLPHVEVRLPGGWMPGRLVGREGNTITLVTDDGIRMVIESDEVRPITGRMTRVLGTVDKLGGFTGKPAAEPKKP
jgi:hypothetical protein